MPCNFCDRKGLLIYPVRYAVACPAGAAGVPGLSGNFKIAAAPQNIGSAKYTLRPVRAGYLYTYDEKRKRLQAYMVTPTGHMWNFPVNFLPPAPNRVQFPCVDRGEIALSHCVDVAHSAADPAGNFWMGWSSVLWTTALIQKVGDAVWRKKHMQCVDVAAMLAGAAAHTAEFKAHYNKIAHFAADAAAMHKAFDYSNVSPATEIGRHKWAEQFVARMAVQAPHNKGFIVAVNDPVGITHDLSELTVPGLDAGFDEDIYRGRLVYDMLELTEKRIRQEARKDVAFSDDMAKMTENNPDGDMYNAGKTLWKVVKAGGPGKYEEKVKADKKRYGDHLEGRQQAASDQAWLEMTSDSDKTTPDAAGKPMPTPTLDEARRKAFPAVYEDALNRFKPTFERLTQAHADWLKSEQLAEWMDGVHDTCDIRSGFAYSQAMSQCVGMAATSEPCKERLLTWLNSGKLSDTRNLYSRALMFNQAALITAAQDHLAQVPLKGSDLQFESVLNIYKAAIERLDKGQAAHLIDNLALTTANVFVAALKYSTYSIMRAVALAHVSVLSGAVIKEIDLKPGELAKWMVVQAKLQGVNFNESNKKVKAAAYKAAKNAVQNNRAGSGHIAYELDVTRLKLNQSIDPADIRSVKIPGFEMTKKWLGSTVPREFHLGVATTIVQMVALSFASQDVLNNDDWSAQETRTKLAVAVVSLSATIMDTVGKVVVNAPTHPMAVYLKSAWRIDADRGLRLVRHARWIGAAAGVVAGAYDIAFNLPNAVGDGKIVLGVLYGVNGALGIAVAYFAYTATLIFWPLLILSFSVGITIALINSGALQQWVSRCYFSVAVIAIRDSNMKRPQMPPQPYPYPTLNAELTAYNTAAGA